MTVKVWGAGRRRRALSNAERKRKAEREKAAACPERAGDAPHEFTPDMEYDSTGQTINCEFCGEAKP